VSHGGISILPVHFVIQIFGIFGTPVLVTFTLKSGLLLWIFMSLGWQPCGKTKNPPAGTGPLISMLNGSLL
jgi:hypothetical protein